VVTLRERLPGVLIALRVALVVFVLAWLFGPYELRSAVPVWAAFLIALALEVQFFVAGLRPAPARAADRTPQAVDRERYGYGDADELVLVRERDEELWIPYDGETPEELDELIAEARAEEPEDEDDVAPRTAGRGAILPPAARRFLVGLGVIGALALVLWLVETRTGWDGLSAEAQSGAEARFSAEAARIAGKPVSIRCDDARDHVGVVQHADGAATVGGTVAYLTPERCLDLYRLAFDGEVRSSQTARALAVLAHEAWHLRGVGDEGATECYALQSGVELGRRLGLSDDTARQLMRQQLSENALRRRASPEYVVPADCRDGGRLDLDRDSSRFP
jgi:hypothetical protein